MPTSSRVQVTPSTDDPRRPLAQLIGEASGRFHSQAAASAHAGRRQAEPATAPARPHVLCHPVFRALLSALE